MVIDAPSNTKRHPHVTAPSEITNVRVNDKANPALPFRLGQVGVENATDLSEVLIISRPIGRRRRRWFVRTDCVETGQRHHDQKGELEKCSHGSPKCDAILHFPPFHYRNFHARCA